MANICVIKRDPANQTLAIEVIDDASGSVVATAGRMVLDLDDLTGTNHEAKFREFQFKDANAGCVLKKCWILMTEPELV